MFRNEQRDDNRRIFVAMLSKITQNVSYNNIETPIAVRLTLI